MTMPRALDLASGRVKVALAPEDNVSARALGVDSALAVPADKIKKQIVSRQPWSSRLHVWRIRFFMERTFVMICELKQNQQMMRILFKARNL